MERAHEVLLQLRDLKSRLLARQLFAGYSGLTRMASGVMALIAGFLLSRPAFPGNVWMHLAAWALVAAFSCVINYGALVLWFLRLQGVERSAKELAPAYDALPPLVVGAILSVAIINAGYFDLLFGTWMAIYGLVNIASRHCLPRQIEAVGWFYVLAGCACLISRTPFTQPWPMASVFFFGELAGGWLFFWHKKDLKEK